MLLIVSFSLFQATTILLLLFSLWSCCWKKWPLQGCASVQAILFLWDVVFHDAFSSTLHNKDMKSRNDHGNWFFSILDGGKTGLGWAAFHGVGVLLLLFSHDFGLNIFYSEEKDWAWHTTRQCPLQRKYLQLHDCLHSCYLFLPEHVPNFPFSFTYDILEAQNQLMLQWKPNIHSNIVVKMSIKLIIPHNDWCSKPIKITMKIHLNFHNTLIFLMLKTNQNWHKNPFKFVQYTV